MARGEVEADLRRALGGREANYLASLSGPQLGQLRDAINTAKETERRALADGIDGALKVVPMLLRKPLKKILFPKG